MQAAYAHGIARFIQTIAPHFRGRHDAEGSHAARERAIATLAGLVGTILLARGVGDADPEMRDENLEAGRQRVGGDKLE